MRGKSSIEKINRKKRALPKAVLFSSQPNRSVFCFFLGTLRETETNLCVDQPINILLLDQELRPLHDCDAEGFPNGNPAHDGEDLDPYIFHSGRKIQPERKDHYTDDGQIDLFHRQPLHCVLDIIPLLVKSSPDHRSCMFFIQRGIADDFDRLIIMAFSVLTEKNTRQIGNDIL